MNIRIRDAAAFASEYQNEPISDDIGEDMLTADEIANKFNKINKNVVPIGAEHITAFIDVQKEVLFYSVCAWHDDFTGYLLDYGTYPDQKTRKYRPTKD